MRTNRHFNFLAVVLCVLVSLSYSKVQSGFQLQREGERLVKQIESSMVPGEQMRYGDDVLYDGLRIMQGLVTGSIKPAQLIHNVSSINSIHEKLSKPTLVAVIADRTPVERASFLEPLFILDPRDITDDSMLHKLFIPYMNHLGNAVAKSRKTLMYSTVISRLPRQLAKNNLMAIYDIGNGVLMVHEEFFESMRSKDILDMLPVEKIEQIYAKLTLSIPEDVSKEELVKLMNKVPQIMYELASPSALCIACMSVLNIVVPFVLNYICYYVAQMVCVWWHLPQAQCTQLEASSLLVAFVMIFPAALVIWRVCSYAFRKAMLQ